VIRAAVMSAALLLTACGSGNQETIEPVPRESSASSNELMQAAEQAAGNADAPTSAEAGSDNPINRQGEMRQ